VARTLLSASLSARTKPRRKAGLVVKEEQMISDGNQTLPLPTLLLVQQCIHQFEQEPDSKAADEALELIVKTFPANRLTKEVYLKVAAFNGLYDTQLFNKDLYSVAELISELDIDQKLEKGSLEVVDEIGYDKRKQRVRNRYVFATKYCHWHRPDFYPLFDRKIEKVLCRYKEQDRFAEFRCSDLERYSSYKDTVNKFICYYRLNGISFRELDKFLWRAK
jgi:hypothetical protein